MAQPPAFHPIPDMNTPEDYMRRALQLALCGRGRVSPNPMVGAVIVADDRIIGEGYHRHFGGPHAEPNAIASVAEADRALLRNATMYVTLEPCAHFGKTPPCARLIVDTGIRKVVVATLDPFKEVAGRGIEIMRRGGVEVETGLLEMEARQLNRRFFTAHTLFRPYIQLKWAQSADGCIALPDGSPVAISSPVSRIWMHRERADADAIMVGTDTVLNDNPALDCRLWPARDCATRPLAVLFDSPRLPKQARVMQRPHILIPPGLPLADAMHSLYADHKITSLMVEGGAKTLQSFIDEQLADEIRIELSPIQLPDGIKAPRLSPEILRLLPCRNIERCGENQLLSFFK